jgi:hypothetical protein
MAVSRPVSIDIVQPEDISQGTYVAIRIDS